MNLIPADYEFSLGSVIFFMTLVSIFEYRRLKNQELSNQEIKERMLQYIPLVLIAYLVFDVFAHTWIDPLFK